MREEADLRGYTLSPRTSRVPSLGAAAQTQGPAVMTPQTAARKLARL